MTFTHPALGQDPWGDDLLTGLTEFDDRIAALEGGGGTPGADGATGPEGPTGPSGPAGATGPAPDATVPLALVRFVGSKADFYTAYPPSSWTDHIMLYYALSGDRPNIVMSTGVEWLTANAGYWRPVSEADTP